MIGLLQPVTGYLGLTLVFMRGGALQGGLNICFQGFLLALAGLLIWQGDWELGYHLWGLDTLLISLKSFVNS